jgi:hypothetical protein
MAPAARWSVLAAVGILAIQLLPVERGNFPVKGDLDAPPSIKGDLRNGCYDCHSNHTRWPWYGAIAPVSWWIAHNVNEGRRRLNFSDWDAYASDPETASHKLDEIAEFVSNGKMAPRAYLMMHPGARLSADQRAAIVAWSLNKPGV